VVLFFGIFLLHERTNVHDPSAKAVVLSRRQIRQRIQSIPQSRIQLVTEAAYTWRPFDSTSPNDRAIAQVIITDSELILRPNFVTLAAGGLLLPSYWIPLALIREAMPDQVVELSFLYRPFALKGGQLVAIKLLSGATCWIRFRSDADWQVLESALARRQT